jgi:hypothetical protein
MPDFAPRQIFIVHESVWREMELWAQRRNFHLDLLPRMGDDGNLTLEYGPDDTPTYAFMPKDVPR